MTETTVKGVYKSGESKDIEIRDRAREVIVTPEKELNVAMIVMESVIDFKDNMKTLNDIDLKFYTIYQLEKIIIDLSTIKSNIESHLKKIKDCLKVSYDRIKKK